MVRFAVWVMVLAGCAGTTTGNGRPLGEGECLEAADCTATGETCRAPGFDLGCGIPPDDLCQTCGADEVCAFDPAGCGTYFCRAKCADDAGCAADESCDVGTGECVARSCEDGFVCEEQTVCDEASGNADDHGCVRLDCAVSAECLDGGVCVLGACYTSPGTCGSVQPPP